MSAEANVPGIDAHQLDNQAVNALAFPPEAEGTGVEGQIPLGVLGVELTAASEITHSELGGLATGRLSLEDRVFSGKPSTSAEQTRRQPLRRRLRRLSSAVLALSLVTSGAIVEGIATAGPAAASGDPDTYSWSGATALNESTDDYGYATCPSNDTGCKDSSNLLYTLNGTTYGEADPWNYALRNCTSYVAEKISQEFNGRNLSGWGNASHWDTAALAAHYTNDSSPKQDDIAVWTQAAGGIGHVAYVASVSNNVATFDEYNVAETGAYTNSYTSANHPGDSGQTNPDYYIHMGTPDTGGGGGGNTTNSRPAAITRGSGDMTAFYRDTSGNLENIDWNSSSGWGNTVPIVDPSTQGVAPVSSNPTAVARDSTDMSAFYRDTNDNLMSEGWTAAGGWQSIPSAIVSNNSVTGDPSVASRQNTYMDVFYRSSNGSLMDEEWNYFNGGWQPPTVIIDANHLGAGQYAVAGSPAAIAPDGNDIDVFYRDTNGDLVDEYYNVTAGWSSPHIIVPGGVAGDPSVACRYSGYMDVTFGTTSGTVVDRGASPSSGWSTTTFAGTGSGSSNEFDNSGVSLVGNPDIVARSSGDMDIFYQDSNGDLVDKGWDVNSGWAAPASRVSDIGDNPVGVVRDSGDMDIFSRSNSGNFMDTGWNVTNSWSQTQLGGNPG